MCQEIFKSVRDKHFVGMLGPLPIALHKRCLTKLNKEDELILEDDK
jgi:hypothetical protein